MATWALCIHIMCDVRVCARAPLCVCGNTNRASIIAVISLFHSRCKQHFFFPHTKRRSRQHYRRHFPKFSPHVQVAICFHPLFLFTSSFSSAFSCIFPSASFRLLCLRILYRRILSLLYVSFAKETYSFKEPTNHMCVLYPARSWPPPPKKHTTRHTHVVSCTHIEENIVSFIGFFCKRDL